MPEYVPMLWFLCGLIFYGIMLFNGEKVEGCGMVILCFVAGPLILLWLPFAALSDHLKKKEKDRARAIREEEKRVAQEEKDAADKARRDKLKSDKERLHKECVGFVASSTPAIIQRIAENEISKDLIILIADIAKKSKSLKQSDIPDFYDSLLPIFRHARINVYTALSGMPDGKIKKISDELTAAIKRHS